jgi:DNA (cytosine-5)-methyltransferase 1
MANISDKTKRKRRGIAVGPSNHSALARVKFGKALKTASGDSTLFSTWTVGDFGAHDASVQVIDMFSGCGGMSLGFAAYGKISGCFRLVGGLDINKVSLDTYAHNFRVPAINLDVRQLAASDDPRKVLEASFPEYEPSKPLVLIGCAPCQGFSAHRKRRWSQVDNRNSLVEAFAIVAASISPDCVVMENVPELLSERYWGHFESFCSRLRKVGYTVKQAIHNAAEYGTPQERFRTVVMAMKRPDFYLPSPLLKPSQFLTVRDAIGKLPPVKAGESSPRDALHRSAAHREATLDVIREVPLNGGSRPPGVGPACLERVKGFYDVYGRLSWDRPAITITHYARNPASGRFVHPQQHRGLTMREAARLQGFPDNFEFTGKFDDVFRQIGEAVPPPMAFAVARAAAGNIFDIPAPKDEQQLVTAPVSDSYAGVIAGIKMRRR